MPWSSRPAKLPVSRPALVLGGGGACGVVQAAYVHAALEAGFRPAMVIGTSVGAINGTWVALHPEDTGGMLRIWEELDAIRLLHRNPMRLASKLLRRPLSLYSNEIVPRLIAAHVGEARFDDCDVPLAVVATNLSRASKQVFRSGSIGPAVLASTAIPGVFDPVEIEGELYVDGCLTASVDLATAVEMGATEILAIDLTPASAKWRPRTLVGVLRQSFGILQHATTQAMEACVAQHLPVRVVTPDLSDHSPWRMADGAAAVRRGLAVARAEMPGIIDESGHVIPGVVPLTLPQVPGAGRSPGQRLFRTAS